MNNLTSRSTENTKQTIAWLNVNEVHDDPQVRPNGYLADVEMADGSQLTLVTSPAQFNEESHQPKRAPELGEHTESALLELGLSWEELAELKERQVIG